MKYRIEGTDATGKFLMYYEENTLKKAREKYEVVARYRTDKSEVRILDDKGNVVEPTS